MSGTASPSAVQHNVGESDPQHSLVSLAEAQAILNPLLQTILDPVPRYFDFRLANPDRNQVFKLFDQNLLDAGNEVNVQNQLQALQPQNAQSLSKPEQAEKQMLLSLGRKIGSMSTEGVNGFNAAASAGVLAKWYAWFNRENTTDSVGPVGEMQFPPTEDVIPPTEGLRGEIRKKALLEFLGIPGPKGFMVNLPEEVKTNLENHIQGVNWDALEAAEGAGDGNNGDADMNDVDGDEGDIALAPGPITLEGLIPLFRCLQLLANAAPSVEELPTAKIKGPEYPSPKTKSKKNKELGLRSLVNLLIAVKINEDYKETNQVEGGYVFLSNGDVDASIVSCFTCKPDFPLIRRELIGCGFLTEPTSVQVLDGHKQLGLHIAKVRSAWEEVVRVRF